MAGSDHAGRHEPGDLGRRVEQRRCELGLSHEQLAARAGMALPYLEYLEHHSAEAPTASLVRLAAALDTTPSVLLGGAVELPSGQGTAAARPTLKTLDREECRRLLGAGGVGRFVFLTDRGPVALPVNYRIVHDDVVFRTSTASSLASSPGAESVGFEVDHIDDSMSEGWSVLVTGHARVVHDPVELQEVEKLGIEPWAGGERDVYLRLRPTEVSGRRIDAHR
jgi:nitroimidazol reductase NimA-like FMN-containing flavoprotein (pyridoxamine 5'-phosphate oxidase superfamily)